MTAKKKIYFPAIDGLRAVAVLAVVLFHFDFSLLSGGYVGVDIFFVISGYLITRNILVQLSNRQFSLADFYIARFRRLIPALLATIAATLAAGILLYSPDALIRLAGSAISGTLSLANIRYWQNSGYFDVDSASKPLLHLWSLSVEEQFYFIWPLILLFCFRVFRNQKSTTIAVASIALLSFILAQYTVTRQPSTAFYLMPFRAYEFALGALLTSVEFKLNPQGKPCVKWPSTIGVMGLILIAVSMLHFDKSTPFPGWYSLLPCLGAVMLLSGRESPVIQALIANRPMLGIGKISYSLYLVHWPIWVMLSFWYFSPFTGLQKLGICVLTLLSAMALYFLVEKRFRYSRSPSKNRFFFIALTLFALAILYLSWQIRSHSGWPQRIAQNNQVVSPKGALNCTYPGYEKTIQDCHFGQQKKPNQRLLLIGDSHSMPLIKALNSFSLKNNLSVHSYSVAGCPPLIGVDTYVHGLPKKNEFCREFSRTLEHLLRTDNYDAVIISARWMWYYEHAPYHIGQSPIKQYLAKSNAPRGDAESSRTLWRESLAKTLTLIQGQNTKVILLSQPPLLNEGIGECDKYAKYLINTHTKQRRCAVQIPYDRIKQRLHFTDTHIESLGSHSLLPIISSRIFCNDPQARCKVLSEEGLLYYDDNHLSVTGGFYLIESISDEVLAFLNTSAATIN